MVSVTLGRRSALLVGMTSLLFLGCNVTEKNVTTPSNPSANNPDTSVPDANGGGGGGDTENPTPDGGNPGGEDAGVEEDVRAEPDVPEEPVCQCPSEGPFHVEMTCEEDGACTMECAADAYLIEGSVEDGCVKAMFVSPGGVGEGLTPDGPMGSLNDAIGAAIANGRTHVFVADGQFEEQVALQSGVHVYGGFGGEDWQWDPSLYRTVIRGQADFPGGVTLVAEGLDAETGLHGVHVIGPDLSGSDGESSYGMRVMDTPQGMLRIRRSTIEAGKGGKGLDGVAGVRGTAGSRGGDAAGMVGGAAGASACGTPGGKGGDANSCVIRSGYDGVDGTSVLGEIAGSGNPGAGGLGGDGGNSACATLGFCSPVSKGTNGAPGRAGASGVNGTAQSDAMSQFDDEGHWLAVPGESGTDGGHGGGGGAGGAGGSYAMCDATTFTSNGGGGGGGGGGGCGGTAGTGGAQGGGAFGLVLIDSHADLDATRIILGVAGDGGKGGDAGLGGNGGFISIAASGEARSGDGGLGAAGGAGGRAGAGASGCGGIAVGITLVGTSNVEAQNVVYDRSNASAGAPGAMGTPDGEVGCDGEVQDMHTW